MTAGFRLLGRKDGEAFDYGATIPDYGAVFELRGDGDFARRALFTLDGIEANLDLLRSFAQHFAEAGAEAVTVVLDDTGDWPDYYDGGGWSHEGHLASCGHGAP